MEESLPRYWGCLAAPSNRLSLGLGFRVEGLGCHPGQTQVTPPRPRQGKHRLQCHALQQRRPAGAIYGAFEPHLPGAVYARQAPGSSPGSFAFVV